MVEPLSIIVDDQIAYADKVFSKFGNILLVDGRTIDKEKVKNADILLVRSVTKVDESLLENTKIKFVGSATSGIDHIDTDYLEESNISFSYAPGSNANSVAEYVLNSLIAKSQNSKPSFSLSDKKIGIIGYGQVGSRVKHFMDIFDVKCLLNDPPLFDKTNDQSFVDLEEVLQSDIVTLHVPLTKISEYPTYNLVSDNFLEKLNPNAIFINTSRGEVVNERALLSFKKNNPESSLILDVWRDEPNINMDLLEKVFIGTPHIAGYSREAKIRATKMLFDALKKFFKTNFDYPKLAEEENISITPNISNPDRPIESIISQHWNIFEDNISFPHYSNLSDNERPLFYDSLRKNYPIRYEFPNRFIDINQCNNTNIFDDSTVNNLKRLGFKLKKT